MLYYVYCSCALRGTTAALLMRVIRAENNPSRLLLQRGAVSLLAAFAGGPSPVLWLQQPQRGAISTAPATSTTRNWLLPLVKSSRKCQALAVMITCPTMSSPTPAAADALGAYAVSGGGKWVLGATEALNRLVPDLAQDRHKGQLGRVGIFGGSKDYTGAPFFASMSALRTGADLAYILTAAEAAPALKAYSPELMVTPVYTAVGRGEGLDKTSADELIQAVTPFLPKLHSLVIGPGMGRDDSRVNSAVGNILQTARGRRLPLVLDADALSLITGDESPSDVGAILRGYPLGAITPNAYEFKRLCERVLKDGVNDLEGGGRGEEEEGAGSVLNGEAAVERLATKLGGVTVVRKGKVDIISNGTRTVSCAVPGGLKRCGGIGDVLSGAMGTMMAWVAIQGFEGDEAEEMRLWAAWWACAITRHASRHAYEAHGRSMSATDVLEHMGRVLEELVPSPPVDPAT